MQSHNSEFQAFLTSELRCALKFMAQFIASEFVCHSRAYLAPPRLFSLLFTTRGFMPNSDHSIHLRNLASFQVRQIRQSTPACDRERTQAAIWSLYIPACFEWFSFSFICQRAVYRRTRWNVQTAAIVFPAYTRNQNGRKVDIANRRKTVRKREFGPAARPPRRMLLHTRYMQKRPVERAAGSPPSSRIKDIINGRTVDRHTYVRSECLAINTAVAAERRARGREGARGRRGLAFK